MKWSDVRVGEPIADSQFDITPPKGTNVIDEVAQLHYVVGDAGEELQKEALQLRELYSHPPGSPTTRTNANWTRFAIYAVVAAVTAVLLLVYVRRRRARPDEPDANS